MKIAEYNRRELAQGILIRRARARFVIDGNLKVLGEALDAAHLLTLDESIPVPSDVLEEASKIQQGSPLCATGRASIINIPAPS